MLGRTRARLETDRKLLEATRHQIAASRRLLRHKFGFGIAGASGGATMPGLPDPLPPDGEIQLAGLVCPDCSGNVVVLRENDELAFRCRVGHEYSTREFLQSKEENLENRAWSAVFAFEELAALLRDLVAHDLDGEIGREACLSRAAVADEQAARLRTIIDADRPLPSPTDRGEGP